MTAMDMSITATARAVPLTAMTTPVADRLLRVEIRSLRAMNISVFTTSCLNMFQRIEVFSPQSYGKIMT